MLRTFPQLTELQGQVLALLDIPASVYSPTRMPLKPAREVRKRVPRPQNIGPEEM